MVDEKARILERIDALDLAAEFESAGSRYEVLNHDGQVVIIEPPRSTGSARPDESHHVR